MNIVVGGRTFSVSGTSVDGAALAVEVRVLGPGRVSILHTGADGRVRSYECVADEGAVLVDGRRFEYDVADPRSLRAGAAAVGAAGPKALKSPMPGRIVRVLVQPGETVEQGQGCVVIEAMKMQNELKAPRAGVVGKVTAGAGETVGAGAVLLVVE